MIQAILGRRIRKNGKRWKSGSHTGLSAMEAKYDYEYLLKYKGASYLHVQWVAATDIEAMNTRSKQVRFSSAKICNSMKCFIVRC